MANTIQLKGDFERVEYEAAATIKPGYLVEMTSAGKVQAHSTEGAAAALMFAVENALEGEDLSDSYASSDRVQVNCQKSGNSVQAWLKAGENVAIGDVLISAGDGTLIAESSAASGTTIEQRIAVALEALDLSDSGDVSTLIDVRLI